MSANVDHGKTEDAESVILAVVAAETVIRNAVAVVAATLLPGAMFRLPAVCTIALPSNLLLVYLIGASALRRSVVLLLMLLPL
jgi:putative NIF3 family GTP cyclohydrolase 1 type 2